MQELYIERNRLDVSVEISSLLTFELDNVRNFASRSTTWSKTIVLPGTANNNAIFGHIFEIGQSNPHNEEQDNVGFNFNAAKSASIILFQDQLQTFKGVLRLLQINITNGRKEYEVGIFGEIALLNVRLSSGKLEDLDFSDYDHDYNETSIVNSWDAAPGSGYYYPLIDYGGVSLLKHDWDIKAFRPALYVKQYIDKMFEAAGFRYNSDLFETTRFKRLIIPHNQKKFTSANTLLAEATITSTKNDPGSFAWDAIEGTSWSLQDLNRKIRYDGTPSLNGRIVVRLNGEYKNQNFTIRFYKNGVLILSQSLVYSSGGAPAFFAYTQEFTTSMSTNDYITCEITTDSTSGSNYRKVFLNTVQFISDIAEQIEIGYNDPVLMNDSIPRNITQIDFFVSIIKLFNLYVYEDKNDSNLVHITPWPDFYSTSSSDAVDWSYKLNRDKTIKIRPMSEITAKKYEFKYKQDGDYYNELYRTRYNEGYGDRIFNSEFEFSEQLNTLQLIFSATPLVGLSGEEKVWSSVLKINAGVEEKTDSNIRILQSKKVTGVTSWALKNGATTLSNLTDYGYGGHLDDPDAPSNDLNFGVTRELFFTLVSGDLSANQFNVYWSAYMAEITDKDSKLVEAWFYLNAVDIMNLDFSKKIMIDGVLLRLNSVQDYNTTHPSDCVVQLLKINYLEY
jgi:hypothetical protein